MSESRTTTLSAFERPWAYVALTKPDVTFLVAMTNGLIVDFLTRPLIKSAGVSGRRQWSRTRAR